MVNGGMIPIERAHPSDGGTVVLMAVVGNYVMVRRPGASPFVLTVKKWQKWKDTQ